MNMRKKIIVIVLSVVIIAVLVHYLSSKKKPSVDYPKVMVQQPLLKDTTNYVIQTGTVVAFNSVDLVARIKGYLEQVEFVDGTFVKKGQGLFVIEPKPYLEQLKMAQSSVVVQKASYNYTKAEYARQQKMYIQNATSLNNVEKWAAKTIELNAEIDKAVANATIAEINYSYTHVLAPFDGRIGRHLIDPGNLVGDGAATNLATIEQIDPIYVYFNLNELDLIKIRKAVSNNAFEPAKLHKVPVYVSLQNQTDTSIEGVMDFVNTSLNASTGTMEFRALLNNKSLVLLPGLFVEVKIPLGKALPQLTIPDTAIQYDQVGAYVLTVDKTNYVVMKRIEVNPSQDGVCSVKRGLNAKDQVIISGLQNAIPGNQVTLLQKETSAA